MRACCWYRQQNNTHFVLHYIVVSRSTVSKTVSRVLQVIVDKLGVESFPLDDGDKLDELAKGFRERSCGSLFRNVVGAFDGYLLRVTSRCVSKQANKRKYFCRKQFYAINCQVGCDSERRITYLSMMCPGATPDILSHSAGPMHAAILAGELDSKWQFICDAAYPAEYKTHPGAFLIPFTRSDLRDVDTRADRDSYNFYLSQLRITIECCFGMLVNKFRILSRSLETTLLSRAVVTFQACCALHNFLINCRNAVPKTTIPRGCRLVQRPEIGLNEVEFVEIPTVSPGHESVESCRGYEKADVAVTYVEEDRADPLALSREQMVHRIAESGYIRPRTYGVNQVPYLFY